MSGTVSTVGAREKKRKSVEGADDAAAKQDKMLALVRSSYLGPLSDEHICAKSVQVLAHGMLENLHKALMSDIEANASGEQLAAKAEKSVHSHLREFARNSGDAAVGDGVRVLQSMLAAAKRSTLEEEFGLKPADMGMGLMVGQPMMSLPSEENGVVVCMFTMLRAIYGFLHGLGSGATVEKVERQRQKRMKEDVAKVLLRNTSLVGITNARVEALAEELEGLRTEEKALDVRRREMERQEDEMESRVRETKKTMESMMQMLSDSLSDSNEDGERGELVYHKNSMLQSATAALNSVLGKKAAEKKRLLLEEKARLQADVAAKSAELDGVRQELECSTDAATSRDPEVVRAAVAEIYEKQGQLAHLVHVKACVQDLLSLPDVLRSARMEIHLKTALVFERFMAHPPPPARPHSPLC